MSRQNQIIEGLYRTNGPSYGMSSNDIAVWAAQAGYPDADIRDPWVVRKAAEAKVNYLYDEFGGQAEITAYAFLVGLSEAYVMQYSSGNSLADYMERRPDAAPAARAALRIIEIGDTTPESSAQGYTNESLAGRNKITPEEVYAIARNVGFTADEAIVMTAIVGAESGYNTRAFNGNPAPGSNWEPENSVGLAQVSLYFHGNKWSREDLHDPYVNLQAAFEIAKNSERAGKSMFNPWSVWKKGTYQQYMPKATAASQGYDPNGPMVPWENREGFDPGNVRDLINIQADYGVLIDDASAMDAYLRAMAEQGQMRSEVALERKYSTGATVTQALQQLSSLVRSSGSVEGGPDVLASEGDPMTSFIESGSDGS